MYNDVLSLASANEGGVIDWSKVFEDENIYKQIYKQEIITALMEANKTGGDSQRVMYVEDQAAYSAYQKKTTSNFGKAADDDDDEDFKDDDEATQATSNDATREMSDAELKANWTKQFLEQYGFSFILDHFLQKPISAQDGESFSAQASQKDIAFLTTLLSVFLQAGFAVTDSQIGSSIQLVRKSSSIHDDDRVPKKKQKDEDHLKSLMSSPEGQDIMLNTNFE